jgi:CubicO group peptidase (beta-lactamase class C family)
MHPGPNSDRYLAAWLSLGLLLFPMCQIELIAIEPIDVQHVKRIESGLLPAVLIEGEPVQGMNLLERMRFYEVPAVSIAFIDRGKVAWTRAYGYADAGSKRKATADTVFQAASISKSVVAAAALRLVQDGKLNLDQNVNEKLGSWTVPDNNYTREQKVTLRRILSHSAGLTVTGFPGYSAGDAIPAISQILNGETPANTPAVRVDAVPGTIWRYSGGGYTVLQLLLTEITGESFPQLTSNLVLRPTGMSHSTFEQNLPIGLRSQAAMGYRDGKQVEGGFHIYPEMAAAGLWTTPSDLARFAIEIQKAYAGRDWCRGRDRLRPSLLCLGDRRFRRGLFCRLVPAAFDRLSSF